MMRLDLTNMEEQSFDDTEPTPEPTPFRPPPPTSQPLTSTNDGNHNNHSIGNNQTTTPSLLNQSLFSFSLENSLNDPSDASLPSLPMEPPSPISKPSESLFSESASSAQQQRSNNNKAPRPMTEVRVIREGGEEESSQDFYECLEDQSLARRTQQSINKAPPQQQQLQQESETNTKPPRTSVGSKYHTPDSTTSRITLLQGSSPLSRSVTPSSSPLKSVSRVVDPTASQQHPSSDDVARVHENALQALMTMKEELVRANDRNQVLISENQILLQDRDSLQREYSEAEESIRRLETSNADWTTKYQQLAQEKEAWHSQKKKLEEKSREAAKQQKDSMKIKLASDNRHRELKTQLDSLRQELEAALASKEVLSSDLGLLQETKTQLTSENASLVEQLEALRQENTHNTLADTLHADIGARDEEIRKLTAQLSNETGKLNNEKMALQRDLESANKSLQDERATSQNELSRLKKALQAANDALRSTSSSLRSSQSPSRKTPSSSSFSPSRRTPSSSSSYQPNSVRFQKEGFSFDTNNGSPSPREGATLETSIADRLARMRDSAERAHLIRSHKRELVRLKQDKETSLRNLTSAHEDELKVALKQANAQMAAKLEQLKTALKTEYDTKLEEVQTKHKKKFTEMQQEFLKTQESADESLHAALSKLATAAQQSERDLASRKSLERSMDQLQTQMDQDRNQLQARHAQELEKRRHEWESERETLLALIQKDCNSAIERHRQKATNNNTTQARKFASPFRATPSTTTTGGGRTSSSDQGDDFYHLTVETLDLGGDSSNSSRLSTPPRPTTVISPSYSDIDTVLRETEDLIQSIG